MEGPGLSQPDRSELVTFNCDSCSFHRDLLILRTDYFSSSSYPFLPLDYSVKMPSVRMYIIKMTELTCENKKSKSRNGTPIGEEKLRPCGKAESWGYISVLRSMYSVPQ